MEDYRDKYPKNNLERGTREDMDRLVVKKMYQYVTEHLIENDFVTIAVPGGRSITGTFDQMKKQDFPWKKIHIFFADERWVPVNHQDSNYLNLQNLLLSDIEIPAENIHIFDPEKGVEAYQQEFERYGNKIDVALIGSGEDGHMASLFPGNDGLSHNGLGYFEVKDSPKPPSRRISLTPQTLQESGMAALLFYGEGKKDALQNYQDKNVAIEDCPVKLMQGHSNILVVTDIKS